MPSLPSWLHPLWLTPTLAIALGWCLLPLAVALLLGLSLLRVVKASRAAAEASRSGS